MTRKLVKKSRKKTAKRLQRRPSRSTHKGKTKRSQKRKQVSRIRSRERENQYQSPEREKALAALARMRREELSLSKATRLEHIKPRTFLRQVGSAVYRSGPGKPWKARKSDTLKARMRILTEKGPVYDEVRGSRERTRNARYEIAVRAFRAGEDGAAKELEKFKGLTVGGHILVTDLDQLIQLEEAGKLDFDNLYYSVGGGS